MAWLELDFETTSRVDLKKAGADRYAEDPTTEVLVLSGLHSDGRKFRWNPGDPRPALMDEADTYIAHNTRFEKAIFRHIMTPVYGWPEIPGNKWHDSQAVAAFRAIPMALENALKVMRIPADKDMEGNKLTLALSRPNKKTGKLPEVTPAIRERVGAYCDTDVETQALLHRRIGWLPEHERRLWLLNQRINDRGVRLDMDLVRQMQKVVDLGSEPLLKEFQGLTGGLKIASPKVHGWLMEQGVTLPNLTKETLDELLGTDDPDYEPSGDLDIEALDLPANVYRALRIKRLIGSASIKKLDAMRACVMNDGRARGLIQYRGTGPGRNSGRLLQPQNFPRGSMNDEFTVEDKVRALMTGDPDMVRMLLGTEPVETVVSSLRHALIPDKGKVFLSGDYSGIQARAVLGVAGQHDKAQLMAEGLDVYIDMACEIWPELRFDLRDKELVKIFKKAHQEERQTGKNSVLGLGFQMAGPKFRLKYAKERPEEFADGIVDTYRTKWAPKVPKLWRGLQDAALEAVMSGKETEAYGITYRIEDAWLVAHRPGGGEMSYFNPQLVRRLMPWSTPDNQDYRLAWTYQAQKMGRWLTIDAFGGQLAENYIMGIERDIIAKSQLVLEANNFPLVLEVHDENLVEADERGLDENAFKQIMEDVELWVRQMGIPIQVDTWAGDRYRK